MIQLIFFLRFRNQLNRTRPELIFMLEDSIIEMIESAGGRIENRHRIITGYFDENSLGVWLTIITLLEGIQTFLDQASQDLYGYSLVIGRDIPDYRIVRLGGALASRPGGTGIWCAPSVQDAFRPYAVFEERISELEQRKETPLQEAEAAEEAPLINGYAHVRTIGTLFKAENGDFPLREKIYRILWNGYQKKTNTLLLGPAFLGKRDGIYSFCEKILGEIPPLILRFGSRKGIGYFADILSPRMHSFLTGYILPERLEELDSLAAFIFRERLREEYSDHLIQKTCIFFQKLLAAYIAAVKYHNASPILVLESLQHVDTTAAKIFIDIFSILPDKTGLQVYGTWSYQLRFQETENVDVSMIETGLKAWGDVFPRVVKFSSKDAVRPRFPEMPVDLWEVAYATGLLRQYFPGILLPQLIGEEEKNSTVIRRALSMLAGLRVIDSVEDPAPRIPDFIFRAERVLGERTERIREIVRNCLLRWVFTGKIQPCFSLLEILSELGGDGGDEIVLNAVYLDVLDGTYQGIEQAVRENRFDTVVSAARGPALRYIVTTLKALIHGAEAELEAAFQEPAPEGNFCTAYKIQIQANLAAYYLGTKDLELAAKTVKEALIIGQSQKQGVVARTYRLFSLVNLSMQHINEAMDYIFFAVENAEKSKRFDELGVAAYYAAVVQFIFGKLSGAEQLIRRSEQAAVAAEMPGWADRARFFRGRLRFEMGNYQDALDIFKSLEACPMETSSSKSQGGDDGSPPGESFCQKEDTVAAWMYRAAVFAGVVPAQKPKVLQGDALLFDIEASYITGDYQRVVYLTEEALPLIPEVRFVYTERPDWRSGFAQCDLLVVSQEELWERMRLTYRMLALCRLPSGLNKRDQALFNMQRLTRDELLPDRDPNDIFYFYAYYRALQESGASEIDLNTAISMAYKRLQRRATRIEDGAVKQAFLGLHRWNSALSAAAKDHKLF